MADVTISEALDMGDDVLVVRGTVDGQEVEARGWVSATTNHFDDDAYKPDGSRRGNAKARAMTGPERRAYCERLLREQAATAAGPKPVPLDLD